MAEGMYTVTIKAETSGAKAEIQALDALIDSLKNQTIKINLDMPSGSQMTGLKNLTSQMSQGRQITKAWNKDLKNIRKTVGQVQKVAGGTTGTGTGTKKGSSGKSSTKTEAQQVKQLAQNYKAASKVFTELEGKRQTVGLSKEEQSLYKQSQQQLSNYTKQIKTYTKANRGSAQALSLENDRLKAVAKTRESIAKVTGDYTKGLQTGKINSFTDPIDKFENQLSIAEARMGSNVTNENFKKRIAAGKQNLQEYRDYQTQLAQATTNEQRIAAQAGMTNARSSLEGNVKAVTGKNYDKYLAANRGNVVGTTGYGYAQGAEEVKSAMSASTKAIKGGIVVSEEFNQKTQKMEATIRNTYGNLEKHALSYDSVTGDISSKFMGNVQEIKPLASYMESLGHRFGEISRYMVASFGLFGTTTAIRDGISRVKELDTAMTELRKTSEGTAQDYSDFTSQANVDAKAIGSTTSQLTESAADFTRLGYSLDEASVLAKNVGILKNVSEFESIGAATEAMISTMEAFDIAPENSMDAINKMNEIGNSYAISTDGIATSLQSSASALVASGNDIDQAIALITAGMKYCLCMWRHMQRTHLIAGNA